MSDLLARLRQETKALHTQTEQLFYAESLQAGTLLAEEYLHLLRTHLIFHQALETAIDAHPDFFRDYAPQTRLKTPWLREDLSNLNRPLPDSKPELFSDWSPIALLGALYVSEGSMLGGTVISRLLQKNEAIGPMLDHTRFYAGYGAETGSNWRTCGAFITRLGTPHADAVVAAAKQAFLAYQTAFLHSQIMDAYC